MYPSSLTVCREPGDLLHGDINGVLSIPLAIADQVAARAAELRQAETAAIRYLGSPEFTVDEALRQMGF